MTRNIAKSRNRLHQLAEGFANNSKKVMPSKPTLKPGTRLVREWRDQVHLVNVEANGYEYKGGRYKSLSQIARLITGTRWSGPLFFGINGDRPSSTNKESRSRLRLLCKPQPTLRSYGRRYSAV